MATRSQANSDFWPLFAKVDPSDGPKPEPIVWPLGTTDFVLLMRVGGQPSVDHSRSRPPALLTGAWVAPRASGFALTGIRPADARVARS